MTIKFLKQLIFLNIILAISAYISIFEVGAISSLENMLFLIISSGFIASFYIKENKSVRYLKVAFFNALFFGFLLSLIFAIHIFIDNVDGGMFKKSFLVNFFYFFIVAIPLIGFWNLFGELVGVVLKGLIERLKITKTSS